LPSIALPLLAAALLAAALLAAALLAAALLAAALLTASGNHQLFVHFYTIQIYYNLKMHPFFAYKFDGA
jgi:hypothetical protein